MKMVVMGTRPEIIKLYSVIKELKPYVVLTGQHDALANQMLKDLKIKVHKNLKVMTKNQSLTTLTVKLHQKLAGVYEKRKPEIVIVQGDTTSAMVAALEAYYHKIPVAHIEAGLRTGDIYSPYPEEVNRRIITQVATYNFSPTREAKLTALIEGTGYVYKVGQTGIDTLAQFSNFKVKRKKQILITLHRRENYEAIPEILEKVKQFLFFHPVWEAIMPVHPNPVVTKTVFSVRLPLQMRLLKPLAYQDMIQAMKESSLIITDSGGVQEEAAYLRIPVLIARDTTERPEGVEQGFARFLGEQIEVFRVPKTKNPYGDGKAGRRIAKWLK